MSDDFPQWWSDPDGEPISILSADQIPEGWVRRYGHYDVQIGQWVADPDEPPIAADERKGEPDPLDHDGKEGKGGSVRGYHSTAAKGARRKKAKK